MSGFSDYFAQAALNYIAGAPGALSANPGARYMALFTAIPSDAGAGGTEVSGTAYARQQVAGNATTNAVTAAANNVLHFASVPAWVVPGMTAYDVTATTVIPAGTTVTAVSPTTVTLSANVTGAGVGATDVIIFTAFSAASGSAPSQVQNSAAVAFVQAGTGGWGTANAFGVYDAVTAGNLLDFDYLGNFSWLPATVSAASPGVITAKAHGFAANDNFVFTTEYGGVAPSFSAGNYTGILTAGTVATDTITVTGVNTSATGNGAVRKVTQQSIPANVQPSFPAGQFVLTAA